MISTHALGTAAPRRLSLPPAVARWAHGLHRDAQRAHADPVIRTTLLAMVVVQLIDLVTTLGGIAAGAAEANPVTAQLISTASLTGLFAEKLALIAVVSYNVIRLSRRWALLATTLCIAITLTVAISNLGLILA